MITKDGKKVQAVDPNAGKTINILVLGQDTREGRNRAFQGGGEDENHQSDTAMIVQISADRSYINIVSIPRDSMVKAASCNTTNGKIPSRRKVMFNSIFALGYAKGGDLASAASCTLATVNEITGLDITNFIVADFSGLSDMINAIGGVNLCIPVDTKDYYTGVNLKH
ncbi:transcriptional regulator, partial [Gardnerella vaginalis]